MHFSWNVRSHFIAISLSLFANQGSIGGCNLLSSVMSLLRRSVTEQIKVHVRESAMQAPRCQEAKESISTVNCKVCRPFASHPAKCVLKKKRHGL